MLVLTRKTGEKIAIGDDITISIVEIGRGKVRIGIDAPSQVSVLRHEVYERIQQENIRAAHATPTDLMEAATYWKRKEKEETDDHH